MSELRDRLGRSVLYLVAPRAFVDDGGDTLVRVLEAGVDIVQLREKSGEAGQVLEAAAHFRRAATETGSLFIVNDRVDVAIAAGADGVHLGQDDLPVAEARRQLGDEKLIGLSTHAPEEIAAVTQEVDYIGVGPVHATPTKPGRPAVGLDLVRTAARVARVPFFAIGGLGLDEVPAVLAAGATRVCVLRAIVAVDDPPAAARALRGLLGR